MSLFGVTARQPIQTIILSSGDYSTGESEEETIDMDDEGGEPLNIVQYPSIQGKLKLINLT